jgi:hypothetical protein
MYGNPCGNPCIASDDSPGLEQTGAAAVYPWRQGSIEVNPKAVALDTMAAWSTAASQIIPVAPATTTIEGRHPRQY